LEAIIEDVITKPFSLAEIRAAVGKVLSNGKSHPPVAA
jgi:DNA-binding response OmpR family regulator